MVDVMILVRLQPVQVHEIIMLVATLLPLIVAFYLD